LPEAFRGGRSEGAGRKQGFRLARQVETKGIVMKRTLLFALTFVTANSYAAMAADLGVRPIRKAEPAPVATVPSPLYLFGHFGVGIGSQKSELTLEGLDITSLATAQPKALPTGALVGLGLGIETNLPIGWGGAEISANYIFSRASTGCVQGAGCLGYSKNAWLFTEGVFWSPFPKPLAFTGWQWTTNMNIAASADVVERTLGACLLQTNLSSVCDTKMLAGFAPGVIAKLPVGPSGQIRFKYLFAMYNESISHKDSPVFTATGANLQNSLKFDSEHIFTVGYQYNFQP